MFQPLPAVIHAGQGSRGERNRDRAVSETGVFLQWTPATGNLPRNFINGTPFFNWDAGLSKNFRFNETMRLQLRMEAFNVLNKAVLSQTADLNVNSNNFGLITTTRTASNPRIIQFDARFDF